MYRSSYRTHPLGILNHEAFNEILLRSYTYMCWKLFVNCSEAACGFFKSCTWIFQKLHVDLSEAAVGYVKTGVCICPQRYMDFSKYTCSIFRSIQYQTQGFPDFVWTLCVTLRPPPLYSETGWTRELWSNCVFLILEN